MDLKSTNFLNRYYYRLVSNFFAFFKSKIISLCHLKFQQLRINNLKWYYNEKMLSSFSVDSELFLAIIHHANNYYYG